MLWSKRIYSVFYCDILQTNKNESFSFIFSHNFPLQKSLFEFHPVEWGVEKVTDEIRSGRHRLVQHQVLRKSFHLHICKWNYDFITVQFLILNGGRKNALRSKFGRYLSTEKYWIPIEVLEPSKIYLLTQKLTFFGTEDDFTFRQRNVVIDENFSIDCDVHQDGDGLVLNGVLAAREGQDALFENELNCPTVLCHNVSLKNNNILSQITA